VAAGANFVVEGTVDFIGFGAENAGEVVRHCGWEFASVLGLEMLCCALGSGCVAGLVWVLRYLNIFCLDLV